MAKDVKGLKLKIIRIVEKGLSPTKAAKMIGLSDQTYYNWRDNDLDFLEKIEAATATAEMNLQKKIKSVAIKTKNANALLALGDRLFGWTPRSATELTGANGAQVVFKVDASGGYLPPNNVLGVTSTLTTAITKRDKVEPS